MPYKSVGSKLYKSQNLFRTADVLRKSARWLALGEGPESPPEMAYDAITHLPEQKTQQSLDFLQFQWDQANGMIASEKIAHYTAMIDGIRRDMERRKKEGK